MILASRLLMDRGVRRGLLLLISWLVVTPALAQTPPGQAPGTPDAQPPQEQAVFKAGIDLVSVTATVRDRRGRLVRGLNKEDFEVLDNGQQRRISDFRADPSPVSLAILFDISGSMRVADRMLAARFAAHHVLSWLEQGRDEAALFTFDSRLHEVAPFTVDTRALQGALGEVDPFGATSLHDAIAEAAQRAAARTGRRRAVVVITDGIDTASGLTPARCLASPARSTCRSTSSRLFFRSITWDERARFPARRPHANPSTAASKTSRHGRAGRSFMRARRPTPAMRHGRCLKN